MLSEAEIKIEGENWKKKEIAEVISSWIRVFLVNFFSQCYFITEIDEHDARKDTLI